MAFLTCDISAILSVIMEAYISAALGSFSANVSAQANFRAGALRAPEYSIYITYNHCTAWQAMGRECPRARPRFVRQLTPGVPWMTQDTKHTGYRNSLERQLTFN